MKLLEDKILKEGTLLEENILKVDSFFKSSNGCKII